MTISLIEADLYKNRSVLIEILNQNRDYTSGYERYKWLYLDNPAGKACAWLAWDDSAGKFIGAAAALPRIIWVRGKKKICHVLSDFSIDKNYRTLGPAIKLNKISISSVFDESALLAYDFPSREMAMVHQWCKAIKLTGFSRYLLPVEVSALVSGSPLLRRVSPVLDSGSRGLLRVVQAATHEKGYSQTFQQASAGSFDKAFDELDESIASGFSLCGARNKSYLAWRYGNNPLQIFYLMKLYFENEFYGYAIGRITSHNRFQIYDLYCQMKPSTMKALINALLKIALKEKYQAVEVMVPDKSIWAPILKNYCFRMRESSMDMVAFITEKNKDLILKWPDTGYITMGDRDT